MLFFQFIVVGVVCWTISVYAVDVEITERDYAMEKFLAQIPTTTEASESSLVNHVQQEHANLRVEGNAPILPGYLTFLNYGSDTTCQATNLKNVHVRRMNECFYGMKYTVGVTASKSYALNVLYFQDSSCKVPKPSATQTFYLPKNQCVGGMKFYTQPTLPSPLFSAVGNRYSTYTYYKFKNRCDNKQEPSKIDAYVTGTCFSGDNIDAKFQSCDPNAVTVNLYGSTGGQCSGTGNAVTYNSSPTCGHVDFYGATTASFIVQSCTF